MSVIQANYTIIDGGDLGNSTFVDFEGLEKKSNLSDAVSQELSLGGGGGQETVG